jgi:hypothetical protein
MSKGVKIELSPQTDAALDAAFEGLIDIPRDTAKRQLDQLISRALAYRTSGELRALLEFTKRFPHIAPFNAMLLHVQNPGIGYALTADQWEKKYKRRVCPGARPYVILWTMGPVGFVFDLSDTEPCNPTIDLVPEIVSNPFPAKGKPPAKALRHLTETCRKIGIELDWRDLATQQAGSVRRHSNRAWDFFLQLNSKHSDAQALGTLAHELAHVFCGHLGETKLGFWLDRRGLDLKTREFEAEAVAWLVTERLNLDIGSVRYLASYLDADKPLPDYSLDAVLKSAGKLEEMVRGTFRPKIA